MEKINLKEMIKFLSLKFWLVVLITLFITLIGAAYSLFLVNPEYEAKTTLLLVGAAQENTDGNLTTEITSSDLNLNSKLVSTYQALIKSRTLLKTVISKLNLKYAPEQLGKMISISNVSGTELIEITVKSEIAEETYVIANELATNFSNQIVEYYGIKNVAVIDEAEMPNAPINNNIYKQLVIYFSIGFVVSLIVVLIMYYFNNVLANETQIENMGLAILASIPEKQKKETRANGR